MTASRVVLYLGLITNIYNNLEIVFRTRFIGFYNLIPLIFQKDSGDGVNSRQPRTTRSEKRYLTFERLFLHLNLPNIRLVDNEFPYQQPSCKCQAMPISECLRIKKKKPSLGNIFRILKLCQNKKGQTPRARFFKPAELHFGQNDTLAGMTLWPE
jgi:hypothetical protein